MKELIRFVTHTRRRHLFRLLLWSLLDSAPVVLSGVCVAKAVDDGFLRGRTGTGLLWLALLGIGYLARVLAAPRINRHVADIVEPLRDALVERTVRSALGVAAAGGRETGDRVTARVVTQVELVRRLTGAALLDLRTQAFAVVGVLTGLLSLAPGLVGVVLLSTGTAAAFLAWQARTLALVHRTSALAGEEVSAAAGSVLRALRDVLAAGATRQAERTVADAVEGQAAAIRATGRAGAVRAAVVAVGGHLPLVLLLALAPRLIREGRLSVGELLGAAAYLSGHLVPMLRALVQTVNSLLIPLTVNVRRLAETTPPPGTPTARGDEQPASEGDLTVSGIGYAYGPDAAPIVDSFSMTFRYGEHTAIVGPSGLGKSTLAQLLAGTLTPHTGEVRLAGVPLARLSEHGLRRAVALIPQEGYVFTGTTRENLRYLNAEARDTDIERAIAEVGAEAVVGRIGGLDARVDPAALSAGERQLLVLARAHLGTAVVTVLDEATCHLDPAAAERAERSFARRPGTLVVIAHRLESALGADRIVVMDGPRPESGTHEELLARSVRYAELFGYWNADSTPHGTDRRTTDGPHPAPAHS